MTYNNRNTVKQLTPAIGAIVGVRFESITVYCTVVDAKNAYGKVRLLVTPEVGDGSQWVELERLVPGLPAPAAEAPAARPHNLSEVEMRSALGTDTAEVR